MDLDSDATRSSFRCGTPGYTSGLAEPCVAILLSTYNGERFLGEQLSSYTVQKHANWLLYWRDDGSTDATKAMMNNFAEAAGVGRCIRVSEGGRLRVTGSFLALLRLALRGPASFFAFSDQDDVWLPDKLAHGVAELTMLPADKPALQFCARVLVDATLRPIGCAAVPRRPPGFPAALTQNVIPGCCMILNRAAAELIDAVAAPDGTWHDWWSYIVVSASDGLIIASATPDILYRQHEHNLVGEPRGFWHRAAGAVQRGRDPFMTLLRRHVAALRGRSHPLPNQSYAVLTIIDRACRGGPLARLRALCIPGFYRQKWLESLIFRLWFLLG